MTDRELLELIAEKDYKAFRTLYDRYRRLFFGWTFSRLNDEAAASDLTQEFWIGVWQSPEKVKFNAAESAKDWLLRHISFQIMDYFRTQCKRLAITDEILMQQKAQTLAYTHVQEEIDFLELQQIIDRVLRDLPTTIQQVYELRCVRHLSAKKTAEVLGLAESTVYNSLSSAVSTLRSELSVDYDTNGSGKLKVLLPLLIWLLVE